MKKEHLLSRHIFVLTWQLRHLRPFAQPNPQLGPKKENERMRERERKWWKTTWLLNNLPNKNVQKELGNEKGRPLTFFVNLFVPEFLFPWPICGSWRKQNEREGERKKIKTNKKKTMMTGIDNWKVHRERQFRHLWVSEETDDVLEATRCHSQIHSPVRTLRLAAGLCRGSPPCTPFYQTNFDHSVRVGGEATAWLTHTNQSQNGSE